MVPSGLSPREHNMQCVLEHWTIVVAGAWNANIFTPAWVSANVFNGQNINLEMQIGPGGPAIKYHFGRMTLIVKSDMIIAGAREPTTEAMDEMSGALRKILELLPYTPVTALGVNFGFREAGPNN